MLTIHVGLAQRLRKSGVTRLPPIRLRKMCKGAFTVIFTFSQYKLVCRNHEIPRMN